MFSIFYKEIPEKYFFTPRLARPCIVRSCFGEYETYLRGARCLLLRLGPGRPLGRALSRRSLLPPQPQIIQNFRDRSVEHLFLSYGGFRDQFQGKAKFPDPITEMRVTA